MSKKSEWPALDHAMDVAGNVFSVVLMALLATGVLATVVKIWILVLRWALS